jgi:UDP-glucose:(heptosyl)LPS alpha-1,3-glucosyltransferase
VLECANFLAAHRGHQVDLIATAWDQQALDESVRVHPTRLAGLPSPLNVPAFALRSRHLIKRMVEPPDVVGSFGVHSPTNGVLWVTSVHQVWMEISRANRSPKGRLKQRINLFHPIILAFERHHIGGRRYRKLIALTEQVKADLIRVYNVPPADIIVIPNGYSPCEFNFRQTTELRGQMRERLGYRDADRVVVFVANELDRKGFVPLLHAIADLRDSDVKLLAVGRLSAASVQAEIDRLEMSSRVRFAGPSGDVAAFYAAADVFALPTQYEAWGLVILEAMACGLPVLTSRLAGASIAVREGRSGELLDDPRDCKEISQKLTRLLSGRHDSPTDISNSVSSYAWQNLLPQYEQVLVEYARQGAPTSLLPSPVLQ